VKETEEGRPRPRLGPVPPPGTEDALAGAAAAVAVTDADPLPVMLMRYSPGREAKGPPSIAGSSAFNGAPIRSALRVRAAKEGPCNLTYEIVRDCKGRTLTGSKAK
jgi:hypothetical protein